MVGMMVEMWDTDLVVMWAVTKAGLMAVMMAERRDMRKAVK